MKNAVFVLIVLPLAATAAASTPDITEPADLAETLEPIRAEFDLPALAAAVVHNGRIIALGAVGERKYKSGVKVTTADRWHLGSCTKAMTATLIAMLIEQGKLKWDTTLADALPDIPMLEAYRTVTIAHLLAHRAGLPNESWPTGKTFMDMHNLPGPPRQQRRAYAEMILNQPPKAAPGEKYIYSNAGFAILGVIAEEIADTPWEELIQSMLFEPLGITTAGFGAMGSPGRIDQPWQHRPRNRLLASGKQAIEPGPFSDNPPVIGPGGIVHCAIADWAEFIILHLENGTYNGRRIIKPETLQILREPQFGGDYAGGWHVCDRHWGGGRVFTHSGTNSMNYAVVWMAPLKRYAVLVATNQGGGKEDQALDKVASTLIGRFKP
ncbi:MAG TPA: serine hydrolase domain-containing protein [Anaerohalosphaeraceae bacterium]|jgi:CubicO group peptidase (beta-lactamase class C family)|nr:serine hydrolase domain-containing protein [Anaerohalosphaeraceae bacterium]HRT51177.1 serine hydrolase domain-containing protein [Anaerohalosphaeraceae bacterium]HRT87230.1 serine hydrolase domain-containing protein [Anaerohalosphaeraceae bacterium]